MVTKRGMLRPSHFSPLLVSAALWSLAVSSCAGFSAPLPSPLENSSGAFSFQAYVQGKAAATANALDASRLHLQILFVDTDNSKARIAEGLTARIAEYNDAMFMLFLAAATLLLANNKKNDHELLSDSAPCAETVRVCEALGLCPVKSADLGTVFDTSQLDEYDLVVCLDDGTRTRILQSLHSSSSSSSSDDDAEYYAPRIRTLAEFLVPAFWAHMDVPHGSGDTNDAPVSITDMLESDLVDLVTPFMDILNDPATDMAAVFEQADLVTPAASINIDVNSLSSSSLMWNDAGTAAIVNAQSWPVAQAGMIVASAGLVHFCLATLQAHLEAAYDALVGAVVQQQLRRSSVSDLAWNEELDEQLRRCNAAVCGYFSPQQRQVRFEKYLRQLIEEDKDAP